MKKFAAFSLKFFGGILFIAFAVYFISIFLSFQGITVTILEDYREWFDNFSDLLHSNWFFNLCFGIGFIIVFIWIFLRSNKDMGWNDLAGKYSIPRDEINHLNIEFDYYGQSYFNDVYYSGIHLSSIPDGLILRHPFPFYYLKPALFIPWDEIQSITIERGLKPVGKNNLLNKIGAIISPWKYANVKLLLFKDIGMVIPWKTNTEKKCS